MKNVITIDLTNANECIMGWFEELFRNEIDDTAGTIDNERLWAKGSLDEEEEMMHEGNIETLEEYREYLEDALKQVNEANR